MDCYAEIREMIVKEVGVEEELVVPDAHLQDDLGADSLALLNLAEAVSARYGIEVLGDDLVDLENVGEFAALVGSKVSEKEGDGR